MFAPNFSLIGADCTTNNRTMAKIVTDEFPVQMAPLISTKNFLLMLAFITGFQCTEPDWHYNALSFLTCFMMVQGSYCIGYSVIRGDGIFDKLETICCLGVCAPVYVDQLKQHKNYKLYFSYTELLQTDLGGIDSSADSCSMGIRSDG